jgi:hypothetical protein
MQVVLENRLVAACLPGPVQLSRDQQRGFTAWGQHNFALWEVVGLQIKLRLAWLAWLA